MVWNRSKPYLSVYKASLKQELQTGLLHTNEMGTSTKGRYVIVSRNLERCVK
jgi:hypothetical protein